VAYNTQRKLIFNQKLPSEPVDISILPNAYRIGVMGHFLEDRKLGMVIDLSLDQDLAPTQKKIIKNYHRIVQTETIDLDADGHQDILVVGFGDGPRGRISIFWGDRDDPYETESLLLDYSGAVGATIHDFDQDGTLDVMVLTSQKEQELLVMTNQGRKPLWDRQVVFKKFAGFGFTHITLSDFNDDQLPEVVLTNGNNMEIEPAPLKAYHGVRILEQVGSLVFEEKYSFQIFGAWKSTVEDFDQDGDQDLAVIAYNPDWDAETPTTFVYLENQGAPYRFAPSILSKDHWGRWITMEKADVDGDKDVDLILGGGYFPLGIDDARKPQYTKRIRNKASVVILKNQLNDPKSQ